MLENHTYYKVKLPNAIYFELDKGAAEPFSGNLESQKEEVINVGKPETPINRYMIINYESTPKGLPKRKLDKFDLLIHDAIWTLYVNGITKFPVSALIKFISGKPRLNPSTKQVEMVIESITRLLYTFVKIEFSQECNQYNREVEPDHKKVYEGQLVVGEIITEKINNQKSTTVVHIFRKPILGELAYMKKQVTTIPNSILSVPIRFDKDTYILRDYLLRRILRKEQSKEEKKNIRIILLETLWDVLSIKNNEYMEKKRTRIKIDTMLSYWQEEKLVSSYKVEDNYIEIHSAL